MSKSPKHEHSGTPVSLLVSLALAIVIFALAEFQSTIIIDEGFAMRSVLMSYIALGLTIAFFWKRLEYSPMLKVAAGAYYLGLWVTLFVTCLAPVISQGDSPLLPHLIAQQFGLVFIALSGLSLIAALVQNQKPAPGTLLSVLGSIVLIGASGGSFVFKGSIHSGIDDMVASHRAVSHAGKKEAAASEEDEEISARHAADPEMHEGKKAEPEASPEPLAHQVPAHEDAHGKGRGHEAKPVEHGHAAKAAGHVESPRPAAHPTNVAKLEAAEKSDLKAAEWNYEAGVQGPAHWSELSAANRLCGIGQSQSPIDIPSSWPVLDDIALDYKLTPVSIVDNGHTIQFNVGPHNDAVIAGKTYHLVQFHIHTPSEHWVDGRLSPMEIHFVHKDDKGKLAVISALVEPTKENHKVFADLWSFVPQEQNLPASPKNKVFNIASLLPPKPKAYRYRGSLTTPPCSEGVLWSVAADKVHLGSDQIEAVKKRYPNNARPIQKKANAH